MNKRLEIQIFLVWILRKRQREGEFPGLIPESKLSDVLPFVREIISQSRLTLGGT